MSTSTAILLAGLMLALGLYFGLRSLVPDGPVAAPTVQPADTPPPSTPVPPPPLDPAVARQHATRALAYHRDNLRQQCYLPAIAGESTQPTVAFEFNLTFDTDGKQIARGVVEVRGTSRPSLTECVLAKLPPLRIPRVGQVVATTVPLSFP